MIPPLDRWAVMGQMLRREGGRSWDCQADSRAPVPHVILSSVLAGQARLVKDSSVGEIERRWKIMGLSHPWGSFVGVWIWEERGVARKHLGVRFWADTRRSKTVYRFGIRGLYLWIEGVTLWEKTSLLGLRRGCPAG
jgi:hypothetical protein